TKRLALINTGDRWLIHLMKDQPGGRHPTPVTKARPSPSKTIPPDKKPAPQPMPDYAPMLATAGTVADARGKGWLFEL
ncbi:hypothetical protein, partial [Bacillus sp. SIMBA_033]